MEEYIGLFEYLGFFPVSGYEAYFFNGNRGPAWVVYLFGPGWVQDPGGTI